MLKSFYEWVSMIKIYVIFTAIYSLLVFVCVCVYELYSSFIGEMWTHMFQPGEKFIIGKKKLREGREK